MSVNYTYAFISPDSTLYTDQDWFEANQQLAWLNQDRSTSSLYRLEPLDLDAIV